ncbi:MAG: ATP-binding cassette domain-containing protein [Nanoarchaeota archaeon]
MKEVCIEVTDLYKSFKEVKAVNGISFKVEKGIIFGLLGPNGAGKSTTIETLIGLYSREGGKINILGLDPEINIEKLQEKIGVQLQSPALFDKLTVKELVSLFASFYQNPFSIEESIKMVELKSKEADYVESLSGGQKHRLAVALAIVSNGEIIFLDEPTTGLDPQSRRNLWDVIKKLKKLGKTIFMTTHYMDEAEKLCDELIIIDQGKVITQGSPAELIEKHFEEDTIEFVNPSYAEEEIGALASLSHVTGQKLNKDEDILLYTMDAVRTISDLFAYLNKIGKPIKNLNVRKPTLEDLFIKLTGKEIRE